MIWSFYWLSFVIWFDLFQCRISGKPSPAVKWVLNGRIISNLSSPPHASRWHPFQSQEFEKKFKHPGGFNFFWNSLLEVQGSSSHQVVSTSFELLWTDFVNISNASSSPLERLYSIREVATAAGNTLILLQAIRWYDSFARYSLKVVNRKLLTSRKCFSFIHKYRTI